MLLNVLAGGGIRPGPSEAPGTGLCCDAAVGTQNVTLLNFLRLSRTSLQLTFTCARPQPVVLDGGWFAHSRGSLRCGSGRATMVRTCLRLTITHRVRRRSPPPPPQFRFGRSVVRAHSKNVFRHAENWSPPLTHARTHALSALSPATPPHKLGACP